MKTEDIKHGDKVYIDHSSSVFEYHIVKKRRCKYYLTARCTLRIYTNRALIAEYNAHLVRFSFDREVCTSRLECIIMVSAR